MKNINKIMKKHIYVFLLKLLRKGPTKSEPPEFLDNYRFPRLAAFLSRKVFRGSRLNQKLIVQTTQIMLVKQRTIGDLIPTLTKLEMERDLILSKGDNSASDANNRTA